LALAKLKVSKVGNALQPEADLPPAEKCLKLSLHLYLAARTLIEQERKMSKKEFYSISE
jgi:hypothetical protein